MVTLARSAPVTVTAVRPDEFVGVARPSRLDAQHVAARRHAAHLEVALGLDLSGVITGPDHHALVRHRHHEAHAARAVQPMTRPLIRDSRVGVSPKLIPATSWPTATVTRSASARLGVPG